MFRDLYEAMTKWSGLRPIAALTSRLAFDRAAAVSIIFAASMVAVIPAIGVAVDITRAVQFRTALQNAADNAALAGAAAYVLSSDQTAAQNTALNYMNKAIATLPSSTNVVSPAATAAVLTSGGTTTGYTVQVATTRSMATTFLSPIMASMSVSVSATAENPLINQVNFNGSNGTTGTGALVASSDAGDHNMIYMYPVPLDNSVPKPSDLVLIYDNDPAKASSNPTSLTLKVAANQKVGFALKNVTGGLHPYGSNGYGGAQGSTHWMYSHLSPPSSQSYSKTTNCALETKDMTSTPTSTSAAPSKGTTGGCFPTMPGTYTQNLALDCTKNPGKVIRYYWNDMGGPSDDHDYNDAAYSIACPSSTSTAGGNNGSGVKGVLLIK